MDKLLNDLINKNSSWAKIGNLPTSIPALSKKDPNLFGACIKTVNNETFRAGDFDATFSLQSISKVFSLLLALMDNSEEKVFANIGMEPTGELFDSISKLETFNSLTPSNPMVNPGAIATTSFIHGNSYKNKFNRLKNLIINMANNPSICIDKQVYDSEKETADKNRSIAYFLRNIKAIKGDVEKILEIYFKQCSLEVTCEDLASMGSMLARSSAKLSENTISNIQDKNIPGKYLRIIKTFMFTCGLYNESGNFAVRVGIPAKSGISGGIMAVVPGRMGIGVLSPPLNKKGNPLASIKLLEDLSEKLSLSVIQ